MLLYDHDKGKNIYGAIPINIYGAIPIDRRVHFKEEWHDQIYQNQEQNQVMLTLWTQNGEFLFGQLEACSK